jgi:hypothetical protein
MPSLIVAEDAVAARGWLGEEKAVAHGAENPVEFVVT